MHFCKQPVDFCLDQKLMVSSHGSPCLHYPEISGSRATLEAICTEKVRRILMDLWADHFFRCKPVTLLLTGHVHGLWVLETYRRFQRSCVSLRFSLTIWKWILNEWQMMTGGQQV